MSELIGDLKSLMTSDAWVSMYFADDTVQTIHTTLNKELLNRYGVEPHQNHFYDLDRMEYVEFRKDSVRVQINERQPIYESEVLNFASRFV